MVRLNMVPHRGVPVVAVHVSERDRRGSEPGYDEDSKHLLESVFHGNPGGKVRLVSVEKRDAKPEATVMRRHFNAVNEAARLLNSRRVRILACKSRTFETPCNSSIVSFYRC